MQMWLSVTHCAFFSQHKQHICTG